MIAAAAFAALPALPALPAISPADSARAVATVYTISLLATLPIVVAIAAGWLLRRASAEGRVLVWRSALATLLVLFAGRELPLHWVAWIIPPTLAAPLVQLGRVQVAPDPRVLGNGAASGVELLIVAYAAGVLVVLLRTSLATLRLRRATRGPALLGEWRATLDTVSGERGVRRHIRLVASRDAAVPMTWGLWRPVIAVPAAALAWSDDRRRMVLLHEVEHIRAGDWIFGVVGRIACALYWFHPGVWWIARAIRRDAEVACDDRVIAAGTRRSDYAELLVAAADDLLAGGAALALAERGGLRSRLTTVLDARHDVTPLARAWTAFACVATLAVAGPMSAVRLAPTRAVLTTLMRDARWESRAYAVLGLAQRADSVAVARDAAELDPNPRVRAWARYALGEPSAAGDAAELDRILHTH